MPTDLKSVEHCYVTNVHENTSLGTLSSSLCQLPFRLSWEHLTHLESHTKINTMTKYCIFGPNQDQQLGVIILVTASAAAEFNIPLNTL